MMAQNSKDTFFFDSGHLAKLEKAISRALSDSQYMELQRCGMIILKPDAIATGKGPQIVSFLKSHGILILDAIPISSPREEQFEELYKFNLTLRNSHNQIASWWLNRQLYTLGPSLLLVVKCARDLGVDIYTKIQSIKGPSAPERATSGQIRHKFNGSNMALNLIHTSDDYVSFFREYLIFSSLGRLISVLDRSSGMVSGKFSEVVDNVYMDVFFSAYGESRVSTDVFLLCVNCVSRLLLSTDRTKYVGYHDLLESVWILRSKLESLGREECITEMMSLGRKAQKFLVANDASEDFTSLVFGLTDLTKWSDSSMGLILRGLDFHNVHLSSWERLVFESSAHYAQSFAAY